MEKTTQYNTCKPWQIYTFACHDLIANCFLLLMNFVSYLAVGEYAILTATASLIITGSRLLDGITDPIVAFIIDRTDSKFGRYRPMMILGYMILTISVLCMYFFCIPGNIVIFIVLYVLYIIGYTFFNTAAGGARSVLTNDPVQRGKMGRWLSIYIQILATGFSFYVSNYLAKKHRGLNTGALQELAITAIIIAGVCLVLSVLAIKDKDIPENYRSLSNEKVSIKDMVDLLRHNKNLRAVIVAAASDKLAQQTAGNSAVTMMVWGIIAGNYAFNGRLNLFTLIPMILIMLFGTKLAMRAGNKEATIKYSLLNICAGVVIIAIFTIGDPTQIGKSLPMTLIFLLVYCVYQGGKGVTNAVVRPMVADISDDELNRSGKYMPGIINATYTFVDKLISSLAATIVGFVLAHIGYATSMPQEGDPLTTGVMIAGLGIWIGLPIIGWTCSVIAMKFYDLDAKRMEEIQKSIAEKKKALAEKG